MQQQQHLQESEPVAVVAVAASNRPGDVRTVAISSETRSMRKVVLQQKRALGRRDASTHPFDPGTPKYRMLSLRPENELGGGHDEEHEEQQEDYSSSTSNNKRLDQRWDGTSSLPFGRG